MSDKPKFRFGVWLNQNRETRNHPHLKASKPVEIAGKRYWVGVWINTGGRDESTEELEIRVQNFLETLADQNGTYPIIQLELEEAENRGQGGGNRPAAPAPAADDEDCPF